MNFHKPKVKAAGSLAALRKLDGFVDHNTGDEALLNCLRTPSPSVNWALAQPGFGLPYGCGMVLYGPPKGGKSVFINGIIGQMHADDPEAVAVKFDTELRTKFQLSSVSLKRFGIDPNRYLPFDVNEPSKIFDVIERDIEASCQAGEKIKLIVIDSLSNIRGRRDLNADTIDTQQRGDQALTIKDGLLRIMPTIRRHNIALIVTSHLRAEQDEKKKLQTGKSEVMQGAWATKHTFEYFCYIEPIVGAAGRVSLGKEEFLDPTVVDFMDNAQKTGHKIRFRVEDSSFPFKGRTAEITLDFDRGFINQYEEIYLLAKNYGLITLNGAWYNIGTERVNGIVKCLEVLRDNKELQADLLAQIKAIDFKRLRGTTEE